MIIILFGLACRKKRGRYVDLYKTQGTSYFEELKLNAESEYVGVHVGKGDMRDSIPDRHLLYLNSCLIG